MDKAVSVDTAALPQDHVELAFPHWGHSIEEIDAELLRLSKFCGVQLLEPGTVARLLHNDSSVCGHQNPRAFDKLRQLLMMHYVVTQRAVVALGPGDALVMEETIRVRLRERFGEGTSAL